MTKGRGLSPDLSVPGWVEIAGDWRWLGSGPPPMREITPARTPSGKGSS